MIALKPMTWKRNDGEYDRWYGFIGDEQVAFVGRVPDESRFNPSPWYSTTLLDKDKAWWVDARQAKEGVAATLSAFVLRFVREVPS